MRGRKDYTIDLDEGFDAYKTASAEAQDELEQLLGFDPLDREPILTEDGEIFDGRLPANVNDLNINELGALMALMDRFTNWISTLAVSAKAAKLNADEQLKFSKAKIRKSKTGNKDDKDDETRIDGRFVDINREYMKASEKYAILDSVEAAARRNNTFLSRLVETKKIQFEQGRRTGNVRKKPARRDAFSGSRRKRR